MCAPSVAAELSVLSFVIPLPLAGRSPGLSVGPRHTVPCSPIAPTSCAPSGPAVAAVLAAGAISIHERCRPRVPALRKANVAAQTLPWCNPARSNGWHGKGTGETNEKLEVLGRGGCGLVPCRDVG